MAAKRSRAEGVYPRGNRWRYVYRDASGKQRGGSAATKAEAKRKRAEALADVARGEHRVESRESFEAYARSWLETYDGRTARGIKTATLKGYRHELGIDADGELTGRGAVAYFGRRKLASISAQDLKAYAKTLADQGKARNTIRLALAPVRAMLATAHEEGVIRGNPAAGLRLGSAVRNAPTKTVQGLTEEQVRAVLAAVPEQHRLAVEFLAQTGMRISEALALTKADVDFGGCRVSVTKALTDGGEVGAPKSRNGVRRVPLSPELARKLWQALATESDDAYVIASTRSRHYLYRLARAAGERAGLDFNVGLHTFRHSVGTIMYRRDVPQEVIRRSLGHNSWEFTASTYLHLNDDDLPDGSVVSDLTAGEATSNLRAVSDGS